LRSAAGTVSAIGLVTEIGDIGRFATARQLMGYLGLVCALCTTVFARRAGQQGLCGGRPRAGRIRLGHCPPGVAHIFIGSLKQQPTASGMR